MSFSPITDFPISYSFPDSVDRDGRIEYKCLMSFARGVFTTTLSG